MPSHGVKFGQTLQEVDSEKFKEDTILLFLKPKSKGTVFKKRLNQGPHTWSSNHHCKT